MTSHTPIADYLANLNVELYIAHYNILGTDWKEFNYVPDYSKFYYIVDGESWLKIDGQEYEPQAGQLFLLPEGVEQSYSHRNERYPLKKYWCHFSMKVGNLNLFSLLDLPHFCNFDPGQHDTISAIFQEMITHAETDTIYGRLLARTKLMELISYYLMNINAEHIQLKNMQAIEKLSKVLAYIDGHLEQEITIHDLADVACLHPNYFIRFFKQNLGITPMQYIMQKKINLAKERLIQTSSSVHEIAYFVGFQDVFHFSKQFKKIVGLTPTQYRKENQ